MKQSPNCRLNLLLVALCVLVQAPGWAQTGANVWDATGIGTGSKIPGTASMAGTGASAIYTVSGQGFIGGTVDSGEFYSHALSGDGTLIARMVSQTGGASQSSRMGLMVRLNLDGHSTNFMVGMTNLDGAFSQARIVSGDKTTTVNAAATYPQWIKVVRVGATISGYMSPDGTSWTQVGTTATMPNWPDGVLIGLAVASNGGDLATGTFDNVTLTQGTPDATGAAPTPTTPATPTTPGTH